MLMLHQGADLYGSDLVFSKVVEIASASFEPVVVLGADGPLRQRLQGMAEGVRVLDLGVLRRVNMSPLGIVRTAWGLAAAVFRVRSLLRETGAIGVYTNTLGVVSGAIAARLSGVRHVWHVHECIQRPRMVARALACAAGRLSVRVICVSQAVSENLVAHCERADAVVQVLYNGFDADEIGAAGKTDIRGELGLPRDALLVTLVGRLNAWKGQGFLLEAYSRLREADQVHVLLVGDVFPGQEKHREALSEQIRALGVEERVHMLGFRSDARAILAGSDIAVVPSTEPDPLPTVVLESMALGLPVIGTRLGGIPEMVDAGATGLLVEPGDAEGLADALATMIADEPLRSSMGARGRERFDRLFERSRFEVEISDLLRDVFARKEKESR